MSSIARSVRLALLEATQNAIKIGDLGTNPGCRLPVNVEVLHLKRVGQEEIDRLHSGVLTVMISPGLRFVSSESREGFRRVVGVRLTVAMRLRKHAIEDDFEACEQFVEELEGWLWDRDNFAAAPEVRFDDLLGVAESRLPYDAELMEKDIFAAVVSSDYEVV